MKWIFGILAAVFYGISGWSLYEAKLASSRVEVAQQKQKAVDEALRLASQPVYTPPILPIQTPEVKPVVVQPPQAPTEGPLRIFQEAPASSWAGPNGEFVDVNGKPSGKPWPNGEMLCSPGQYEICLLRSKP